MVKRGRSLLIGPGPPGRAAPRPGGAVRGCRTAVARVRPGPVPAAGGNGSDGKEMAAGGRGPGRGAPDG